MSVPMYQQSVLEKNYHKFLFFFSLQAKLFIFHLSSHCGYLCVFSSVLFSQLVVSDSLHPHGLQLTRLPCPSLTPKIAQTHVHRVGNGIQQSHPLPSFLLLPSIFPSIRVFSSESVLHIRWPKYQSFNFNISPSNEYSGLISFRIDWLDFLAVQGILKSLLQYHSSKAALL